MDRWRKPAVLCGDTCLTYEELLGLVKKFGSILQSLGNNTGDRVAIVSRDCPEFIISFLGAIAVGSVSVPISTMLSPAELEYVLNHCGAKVLIISSDQIEKLQDIRSNLSQIEKILLLDGEATGMSGFNEALLASSEAEIEPVSGQALAFILYTSGSTGRPKGAMHLHRNLPYTVETYCNQILKVRPEDRLFSSSRLFFAYGLGNSLSFPLCSGATTILCKERPTPVLIDGIFRRYQPTIFFGVPALFRALIEYISQGNRLETDSIDICVSAGEKLPETIIKEWKEVTGLDILDGIGSTEMLHIFISNSRDQIRPGSSGKVVPGYEARLLNHDGLEIEGSGVGDLMIRGASASPGYWNDPEKTAATMRGEWMSTGDIYSRDEEGYYGFEGRSDDMFKVKGLWVSPVEVEDALLGCTEVLEAAVVPQLNKDGMNVPAAYVVLRSNQSRESVLEKLRSRVNSLLPPYKCPAVFYFLEQLPRTATGKLQRFKLREKKTI
jgi:benzoate-CoA ligase family protein